MLLPQGSAEDQAATETSQRGWTTDYSNLIIQFSGNWLKGFLLVLLPWKRSAIITISLFQLWLINSQRDSLNKEGLKMWFSSEQELWVHECGNRRASNHLGEIITSLLQDCNMITSTCFKGLCKIVKAWWSKFTCPVRLLNPSFPLQSVIFICSSLRGSWQTYFLLHWPSERTVLNC